MRKINAYIIGHKCSISQVRLKLLYSPFFAFIRTSKKQAWNLKKAAEYIEMDVLVKNINSFWKENEDDWWKIERGME